MRGFTGTVSHLLCLFARQYLDYWFLACGVQLQFTSKSSASSSAHVDETYRVSSDAVLVELDTFEHEKGDARHMLRVSVKKRETR